MFSIDKAVRDQREPGSLLARLRGGKMRDPGNEVGEERKICPKICLFGFPEVLVMGSATTAVCKVVSSSTLIGPFKI